MLVKTVIKRCFLVIVSEEDAALQLIRSSKSRNLEVPALVSDLKHRAASMQAIYLGRD
jgi:hypothetical protein